MKKKILIVVGIIVLIYVLFVTVDCIRLKSMKHGFKPLITLEEEKTDTREYYTGLGYNITYYINKTKKYDMISVAIYGAEFRLFDKILIWAWVE